MVVSMVIWLVVWHGCVDGYMVGCGGWLLGWLCGMVVDNLIFWATRLGDTRRRWECFWPFLLYWDHLRLLSSFEGDFKAFLILEAWRQLVGCSRTCSVLVDKCAVLWPGRYIFTYGNPDASADIFGRLFMCQQHVYIGARWDRYVLTGYIYLCYIFVPAGYMLKTSKAMVDFAVMQ